MRIQESLDMLGQTGVEKVTTVVAGASVSSYWWLDSISHFAASWLPVLGCAWLILQGAALVYRTWIKKENK